MLQGTEECWLIKHLERGEPGVSLDQVSCLVAPVLTSSPPISERCRRHALCVLWQSFPNSLCIMHVLQAFLGNLPNPMAFISKWIKQQMSVLKRPVRNVSCGCSVRNKMVLPPLLPRWTWGIGINQQEED